MKNLSQWWEKIQGYLFPCLEKELGPLNEKQQQFISILELIRIEDHIPRAFKPRGRPCKNRVAIGRAFIAKSVYNFSTTRALIDRLETDISLRRICGWEFKHQVPDEATFSRAFAEFAKSRLAQIVHDALIKKVFKNNIVHHVSRDSTAIEAREKPMKKLSKKAKPSNKRGRPKKDEIKAKKELTRIEKQLGMSLSEMLNDLPKACDVGTKKNSKGYKVSWIGYKAHIDTIDGDIPISIILSSASLHDSQAAIPLAEITKKKILSLYDLMDAAYDVPAIKKHSQDLGHVPIIDLNPRRNKDLKKEIEQEKKAQQNLNWEDPHICRYKNRSSAERVNSQLKDTFGGRMLRVRGHAKVYCHLMFGLLALTASQILNLVR